MSGSLNLNRQIIGALVMITGLLACGGNGNEEDYYYEDLVEELEDFDYEDYEQENEYVFVPDVIVYDEERRINEINIEIADFKIKELEEDYLSNGELYVLGDDSYKDVIIDMITSPYKEDDKDELMIDLMARSHPDFVLTDRKLQNAVVDMLMQDEYEINAIQLIQKHQFKKEQTILENHLLSGNSSIENQLFQSIAMANYEPNMAVLDYFEDKIYEDDLGQNDLQMLLKALNLYHDNGNLEIQNRVGELSFSIYDLGLINESEFIDLKTKFRYNAASQLLLLMFKCGGENVTSIAEKYIESPVLGNNALRCLIKMEGDKHRRTLLERFKSKERFFEALDILDDYYTETNDERMVRSAIVSFENIYGPNNYDNAEMDGFVSALFKVKGDSIVHDFEKYLKNRFVKDDAMEALDNVTMSLAEIAAYLLQIEFVERPINISQLSSDSEQVTINQISNVVEELNRTFWVDEDDSIIGWWRHLLQNFISTSNGKLNGLNLMVEWQEDYDTHFQATLNEKAYSVFFPQRDRWDASYMDDYIFFINFILEDQGHDERFLNYNYGEYIFGTERSVYLLKQKLKIIETDY